MSAYGAARNGHSGSLGWKSATSLMVALALSTAVGLVVRTYVEETGVRQLAREADERLSLLAATFTARLERFRYLPDVIARSREVESLLTNHVDPQNITASNRLLKLLGEGAGALALYVIDATGLTRAASNYDRPDSFVGQNYRFRPYFQDAVAKGEGRYYGVGATTGVPGYFVSTGIRDGRGTLGAAVVKIDLLTLEAQWREAGELVSVIDSTGIVFLSSQPAWRYHATRAISTADRDAIKLERRYGDASLPMIPWRPREQVFWTGNHFHFMDIGGSEERIMRTMPLGEIGWSLAYFASPAPARLQANVAGLAAAFAVLLGCSGLQILRQERRVRKAERKALKNLEIRVAERTAALVETNHRLAAEITERESAQHELGTTRNSLDQAAKLATIGQAFAGFAHEINQPLAAFRTQISSIRMLLEQNRTREVRKTIDVMDGVVERMSNLTSQLKGLARQGNDDFEDIDFSLLVRRIADLLKFQFDHYNVEFINGVSMHASILGSKARLEQVMLNLLTNAIDAVAGVQRPKVEITFGRREEGYEFTVHDNGPGVNAAVAGDLFKPFFTTKAEGKGLGLGLSIVHRIVMDHHGVVRCDRSHLGGAAFTVWLPRAPRTRV